jgi:hypothetical protein
MNKPWIIRALYQVWPKIYRFINRVLFFIMMVIRGGVKEGIRQIKRI